MEKVATFVASAGIVFGGVIPYIPQYFDIKRTENAEGFSLYVCLILLIANILRIFFWFGKQFETPLLLQSIFMIAVMLAMIELCVRVKSKNLLVPPKSRYFLEGSLSGIIRVVRSSLGLLPADENKTKENVNEMEHHFWDFDAKYFWKWTDFTSYMEFIASITVIMGVIMYAMIDNNLFVETIGFASTMTEALLAAPQLLQNYRKQSTEGLSRQMVAFWALGDAYKTGYFFINKAPIQFLVCGMLQLTIDFLIALQIVFYEPTNQRKFSAEYVK